MAHVIMTFVRTIKMAWKSVLGNQQQLTWVGRISMSKKSQRYREKFI